MSEQDSLLSVIMPVYNGVQFLESALDSVTRQAYRPLEIVIVDDGSTDTTAFLVKAYAKRSDVSIIYEYQPNRGPSAARNRGIGIAKGSFISFIDADDLWDDNKLADQMAHLLGNPETAIVWGMVQMFEARGQERMGIGAPWRSTNLGAGLFRRHVFQTVGLFDQEMRFSEDMDWCLRADEKDVPQAILPKIALWYRQHTNNMWLGRPEFAGNFLSAIKKRLDRQRASWTKEGGDESRFRPTRTQIDKPDRSTVTVIIVVRNGARFLAEAISSALSQSYQPTEIIIVDGHSTDDTAKIAKSFPEVRYLRQNRLGISNAYNLGIQAAQSEFVAFLSHDDLWTSDKLAVQIQYLLEHQDIMYCVAQTDFFLEPGNALPPGFRSNLLTGEHPARIMETLVARRHLFNLIGGFDEGLNTAEDVEWYARAADAQIPMMVINQVLLHKRIHDQNASLNTVENNRNLLMALRKTVSRKHTQDQF